MPFTYRKDTVLIVWETIRSIYSNRWATDETGGLCKLALIIAVLDRPNALICCTHFLLCPDLGT